MPPSATSPLILGLKGRRIPAQGRLSAAREALGKRDRETPRGLKGRREQPLRDPRRSPASSVMMLQRRESRASFVLVQLPLPLNARVAKPFAAGR